jgi:hypothetical protein
LPNQARAKDVDLDIDKLSICRCSGIETLQKNHVTKLGNRMGMSIPLLRQSPNDTEEIA